MANKIKVYAENSDNVLTDDDYAANSQRSNGAMSGEKINSSLTNTVLKETSTIAKALVDALMNMFNDETTDVGVASAAEEVASWITAGFNNMLSKKQSSLTGVNGINIDSLTNQIGHTNNVASVTSYKGNANLALGLKYDAQGHITGVTTYSMYPPTTTGENEQICVATGTGSPKWVTKPWEDYLNGYVQAKHPSMLGIDSNSVYCWNNSTTGKPATSSTAAKGTVVTFANNADSTAKFQLVSITGGSSMYDNALNFIDNNGSKRIVYTNNSSNTYYGWSEGGPATPVYIDGNGAVQTCKARYLWSVTVTGTCSQGRLTAMFNFISDSKDNIVTSTNMTTNLNQLFTRAGNPTDKTVSATGVICTNNSSNPYVTGLVRGIRFYDTVEEVNGENEYTTALLVNYVNASGSASSATITLSTMTATYDTIYN